MIGIDSVSHVEEFSLIFTAINGHDVKMFVARERLPHLEHTPHRSVSTGAQEARQSLVCRLRTALPPGNLRKPAIRQPPQHQQVCPHKRELFDTAWNDDRAVHLA